MVDRAQLGQLVRALRYRSLLTAGRSGRPVVAYVGWTGEGNLGDEAMYLAHREQFAGVADVVPVPLLPPNPVLRRLGPRIDVICLGGGTLIGNGHFRVALEAVMAAAPDALCVMMGPGSEDGTYTVGRRAGVAAELARWPELLARFDSTWVRGPRSVETLAAVGVDAGVSGDPALLMPFLDAVPESDLIGINVGITDDQWGDPDGGPEQLLLDLVELVRGEGLRVRLLATTEQDQSFLLGLRHRLPADVQVPDTMPSVHGFLELVAPCAVVIGMKLHAQVLAVTQHVPVIALEYRPKCRDFMLTVGRGDRCMRTDSYDAATLLAWLRADLAELAAERERIGEQVEQRRAGLLAVTRYIRGLITAPQHTDVSA